MSTLEFILTMLETDGISEPRKLMYLKELRKLESDAFVSGKHFAMDGKGGVVPGLHGSVRDADEAEMKWHQDYNREQEERMEEYAS